MSLLGNIIGLGGLKKDVTHWLKVVAALFILDILTRLFLKCGMLVWW